MNLRKQQHIKHGNGSGSGSQVCLPNSHAHVQGNRTTLIEQQAWLPVTKAEALNSGFPV
jgi:hypothetical protein